MPFHVCSFTLLFWQNIQLLCHQWKAKLSYINTKMSFHCVKSLDFKSKKEKQSLVSEMVGAILSVLLV